MKRWGGAINNKPRIENTIFETVEKTCFVVFFSSSILFFIGTPNYFPPVLADFEREFREHSAIIEITNNDVANKVQLVEKKFEFENVSLSTQKLNSWKIFFVLRMRLLIDVIHPLILAQKNKRKHRNHKEKRESAGLPEERNLTYPSLCTFYVK